MLRRFTALPWSDIFWSAILVDLGLLVLSPLTLLLFLSNPVTAGALKVGAIVLPLLFGGAGGFSAKLVFDKLSPDRGLTQEVRWALALCVGITTPLVGWLAASFFQYLPTVLNMSADNTTAGVLAAIGQFLALANGLLSGMPFIAGAVVGIFWGWRRY